MKSAITFDGDRRRMRVVACGLLALAAATAIIAAIPGARAPSPARAGDVMLIYVGADDCAPCRVWQNGDGAEFRQSSEFTRIAYVEVKSPRLHDVLRDDHWPEKVRAYRDSLKRNDGVPLWLLVSNGKVIEKRFGPAAWHASMLPSIKSALR